MSNIKIKIKQGTNEIEREAPIEFMSDAIEFIPKVMEKIAGREATSMPNISIEKGDSNDIILKLFKDGWLG